MPTRRAIALGSALLAVAAFGACGDDDDAETLDEIQESIAEGELDDDSDRGDRDGPDPCALVTQEDVESLFAEAADQREEETPTGLGVSCLWQNVETTDTGQVHVLTVNVYDGAEYYAADVIDGETEIADLGDRAYVSTSSAAPEHVEVQFVQDGRTVIINYSPGYIGVGNGADRVVAADHADAVIALARQASARM
ncbi:MAG: hypothetical protein ABWZ15_00700 [Acidimicrobiia bacterium]